MPPKLRSSNTNISANEDKQAMAASPDAQTAAPLTPDNPDDPNHKQLLDIIANQKISDEKQEQRHRKLTLSIQAHKTSLDKYIEENDKALGAMKINVTANTTSTQALQNSVTQLQNDLTTMKDRFDATQKLLDDANTNLEKYAATISKLDIKYVKDEEEMLRCQLIIDGVREQGTKRPKTIVTNLLKDLEVDFIDSNIKSAFRLGPIRENAARPRSIKVQFINNNFKYDIFKNIQKLKGKEMWKGVHICDAVTIEEQERRRDMRCIYAVG